MARSEEQKKDLKFKLYVAGFLLIVLIPIVAIGPGIGKIADSYWKQPTHPNSAKRLLLIAHIQANTMRGEDAEQTLALWMKTFVNESDRDFDGVVNGEGEWVMPKYGMGEGLEAAGFTPWLFPEGKPEPAARATDEDIGAALDLYAKILEEKREYPKVAHIYVCLCNMWPKDSEVQLLGVDGFKRCAIRSF